MPADCETMLDVRKGVDALDRALVLMLAERQRYMDAAAREKFRCRAAASNARRALSGGNRRRSALRSIEFS